MGLNHLEHTDSRKVWKSNGRTNLLDVTGFLETGHYTMKKTVDSDGKINIQFIAEEEE